MTTRITDNGITVLSPAVGMRLTDGETVAEGDVYLGANAAPDAWREVTEAEAEEIRSEAEELHAEVERTLRRAAELSDAGGTPPRLTTVHPLADAR